jgi:hypothetical protein
LSAKRVSELLASRRPRFLVVCAPQGADHEAVFHRKLVEAKMPFRA